MYSLLFADNTVMLAESAEDMRKSLQCLQTWCEEWSVEINVEKTACYDAHEEEEYGTDVQLPSRLVWMKSLGFLL